MFDFLKQVPAPVLAMAAVTVFGVCALLAAPGPGNPGVAADVPVVPTSVDAAVNANGQNAVEDGDNAVQAMATAGQVETVQDAVADESETLGVDEDTKSLAVDNDSNIKLVQVANNFSDSDTTENLRDTPLETGDERVAYSEDYPDPSERIAMVLKNAVSSLVFNQEPVDDLDEESSRLFSDEDRQLEMDVDHESPEASFDLASGNSHAEPNWGDEATEAPAALVNTFSDRDVAADLDEVDTDTPQPQSPVAESDVDDQDAEESPVVDEPEYEAVDAESEIRLADQNHAFEDQIEPTVEPPADDLVASDAVVEGDLSVDESVQYAATIEIRNPETNRLPVSFLLNSEVVTLAAGESKSLPVGDGVEVRYSRGGNLGVQEISLEEGSWAYSVSREAGWQLSAE